jgi:hypothetical protein
MGGTAMTGQSSQSAGLKRFGLSMLACLAVGLVFGAAVGGAWAWLEAPLGLPRPDVVIEDAARGVGVFLAAALLIGLALLVAGLGLLAASLRPGWVTQVFAGQERTPATPLEVRLFRMQAVSLLLAGALAATPVVALYAGVARGAATTLVAVLALGTLLQAAVNVAIWRRADELTRRATVEAAAAAFILFEGVFFVWAAAEMLGLAPVVSAWAIWTLVFVLYLAAATYVGVRRGLT